MHPQLYLSASFFILSLLLNTIHASPRNHASPLLTSYALDLIIASNPHPFNQTAPIPEDISNPPAPSVSKLRSRANPPPYRVPIDPNRPYGPHITIFLQEAAETLAVAQVEYVLVALNNVISEVVRDPVFGGPEAVIPENAYPLHAAPRQAMDAYISIEPGEDGGMRWSTVQLAIWGLWNLMVLKRRGVEVQFEI
ncbi:MAG: hypothetical protein Q9226_004042, partial [Calogaya cf. arnoldii]